MSGSRGRRLVLFGLFVIILLTLFSQQILYGLGAILVNAGPPRKADMIIVLGGDWEGNRILKAAELIREGYAPFALVSGVAHIYGRYESDIAIDFAVSRGALRGWFVPTYQANLNTQEEVRDDLREARARGVHRIMLVTSEFHTGRAGRIFRHEAHDMEIFVVASETDAWNHGKWWKDREGQKIWLAEFEKNVAGFLHI